MKYSINPKIDNFLPYDIAVLKARGVENPKGYLNPGWEHYLDASVLDNIVPACMLLRKHFTSPTSRIALIVDSDMDGICSAAMVYLWAKNFFPTKEITYLLHEGKQHGLEDMMERLEDFNFVIIPDAGSNDYEFHRELKSMGTDILVLDHHEAEKYSEDAVVVNNQLSKRYANKNLCGSGVVLKFLHFYEHHFYGDDFIGQTHLGLADSLFDLAAAATISDVMSLTTTENRFIVSKGLANITNYGLKTFVEKQAYSLKGKVTPIGIAFYIAPIVNAILRVGTYEDKDLLFRAFIRGRDTEPSTKRGHKPGEVEIVAEKAFRIGTNCRSKQNKLMDLGEKLILNDIYERGLDTYPIIFVDLSDELAATIPSELTGLIAMRINNDFNKPTLIGRFGNNNCIKGSIRNNSKNGLDFKEFLLESSCFEFVEGHANAAGFSIPITQVEELLNYSTYKLHDVDLSESIYVVDYEFTQDMLHEIDILADEVMSHGDIWGNDVEAPKIAIKDILINSSDVMIMGKDKDSAKVTVDGIEIVKFKDADFVAKIQEYPMFRLTAVGEVGINEFAGRTTSQFIIRDYELANAKYDF